MSFVYFVVDDLHMDRMTACCVGGFHQHFAKSRVGVDVAGDLRRGQLHHLGDGQLGEQLGDFRADQVGAENFAIFGISDQLDPPA